jgi:hypothetical protein
MSKHKSEDYKISAVKYFIENNDTQENVCKIFKCSVRSLLRWTERYKDDDEIKRHNRKPIAYKVTKEHVKFILNEIKKDKTITTEDLLIKVKEKFKYILICNGCEQTEDNTDIRNGEFRHLSCDYFPLKKYNTKKLYNYHAKEVFVIETKSEF